MISEGVYSHAGNARINDCPGTRIPIFVGVLRIFRPELCVMPFPKNNSEIHNSGC